MKRTGQCPDDNRSIYSPIWHWETHEEGSPKNTSLFTTSSNILNPLSSPKTLEKKDKETK